MSTSTAATAEPRLGLRRMLATKGFNRLLASRFAAQWGDGIFQAGLGAAVVFNPERAADPMAVAAGLAVLLLPYSLVGPFAGALLDRWDRRKVLVGANLLRGALITLVAISVATGVAGAPLYIGALLVTGVSRFVLAGLSAGLPHVVARRNLVEANALAATAGAAITVLGTACAIGLRELVGSDNLGSGWVTASAVLGSAAAALIASGFRRGQLGPDETDEPAQPVVAVALGLRDGLRAASRVRSVAAGLVALAAHRLSFGVATLITLLLYRYTFRSDGVLRAGLAGIGQALAAGGIGVVCAAFLTPVLVTWLGRRRTVRGALLSAALMMLGLGLPMQLPTILAAAFGLACAGQVVKLSLDAAVQRDIGDESRGRVFSLYDMVFNVGYVAAVWAAATVVPLDGRAPWLLVAGAAVYLLAAVAHLFIDREPAGVPG